MAFITLKKYVTDKGTTENSVRKLITRHWEQGVQWVKTPANRIMVDPVAVEVWEKSGN